MCVLIEYDTLYSVAAAGLHASQGRIRGYGVQLYRYPDTGCTYTYRYQLAVRKNSRNQLTQLHFGSAAVRAGMGGGNCCAVVVTSMSLLRPHSSAAMAIG